MMARFWLCLVDRLRSRLMLLAASRAPDFVIGGAAQPYLRRWWLVPRNRFFNIYLHQVLRSDDDRALHDHPWFNMSLILAGGYAEHRIRAGGVASRRWSSPGRLRLRSPWSAHRLEVETGRPCWTLFVTGPWLRDWGFHCANGWRHWRDFTGDDPGSVGRGCA